MKLYYTQRAKEELDSAIFWYENQRIGLGLEFLDCVENAVSQIIEAPFLYALIYSCFRRCITKRFPYSIFYSVEDQSIIIHAIFDNRKDPSSRP